MNLLQQAAADLVQILQDVEGGFAVEFTVRSPLRKTAKIRGFYNNVDVNVDPETGMQCASNKATAVLPLSALAAAHMSELHAAIDNENDPWTISVVEVNGEKKTFRVRDTLHDELGCVVCILEAYQPI